MNGPVLASFEMGFKYIQASELKGLGPWRFVNLEEILTSENQGNALRQDVALLLEAVFVSHQRGCQASHMEGLLSGEVRSYCPTISRFAIQSRATTLWLQNLHGIVPKFSGWSCLCVFLLPSKHRRAPDYSSNLYPPKIWSIWLFRAVLGLLPVLSLVHKAPKHPLKKSYRSYFRRAQIRWVIWRSSKAMTPKRYVNKFPPAHYPWTIPFCASVSER